MKRRKSKPKTYVVSFQVTGLHIIDAKNRTEAIKLVKSALDEVEVDWNTARKFKAWRTEPM